MKICIITHGWTNDKSPYSYLNTALITNGFYVPIYKCIVSNMISIL